ncbi:MAG: M6 family metalloprotease domain-containing protein [Bacteroidales bacterium]|nr:M6 family metalloprotease domain-containing protein [Bacteroidales bacterium]
MKKLITLLMACFCMINVHAAYLRNIPMTLTQPDGTVLHCFASGDEYFNYLHDENGFTIMQHPQTGYYVYAEKRDGKLVATNYVAGIYDPASKGLKPYALISPEEWMARRKAWEVPDERPKNRDANHGTLNNISIFIRFSDDGEFTNTYSSIDNMFNDMSTNGVSLRKYFQAASYGAIDIPTYFYPGHNGETIISYQDTYPRSYFQPYNSSTNTNGYQNDTERREREFDLLERAVTYINNNYPIPTTLNIDYDNDNCVDNVCFIVRGDVGAWSSLLWPHKWSIFNRYVYINNKRVYTFNFQLADASGYFNAAVMCHEMNHSLSAPDLYHYYYGEDLSPVGPWDLMENTAYPPQHCGAYMKMKYGNWIDNIPEITQAGTYTLNPISSSTPTNVAYKIASPDPDQFYVLEYRDNTSLFESALPGSGLLIYRIDTRFEGNADYEPDAGIYDEVYLYRPSGTTTANGNLNQAHFSSGVGRTSFDASTNPYPFLTDGTVDNELSIYNITSAGSTISFTFGGSSIQSYTITASADPSDCGTVSGGGSYTSGSDCILTATPNEGYLFINWTCNGNVVSTASTYTFTVTDNADYVAHFEEIGLVLGEGTATNIYLPSYSFYNYSLTQQIYTASEIGMDGNIYRLSFYNDGATKTRTYDVYMVHTDKTEFSTNTDWITVTEADRVFSGTVTMTSGDWTTLILDTPFVYDGVSNLAIVVDDNSGNYTSSPHMACRVYNAEGNQAIRIYSDGTNYDPYNPSSYNGTRLSVKNQIILKIEKLITLGEGTATNAYLPSYSYYNYSLTQQIYTASEIGTSGFITSLSFYNDGATKTRTYDVYMVHTDKTEFSTNTDWITVTEADKVFSGTVTMNQGVWTTIVLDGPFAYSNMSNLAIVVDDNSGDWTYSPHMACRVYNAEGNQAIRIYNDDTNYDPYSSSSYNGTLQTVKNQIELSMLSAGDIVVGESTALSAFLPSYSFFNYSLTQQIYTPSEIGMRGKITSLSFYNEGASKTRSFDIYMTHTSKTEFESSSDWITVAESDMVFSGTVTMAEGGWTTLVLDTPFAYNGSSNMLLVVDDNSGNYTGSPHMACRVYNTEGNQAIRIYSDGTNYDPFNTSGYSGTRLSVKNQIKLSIQVSSTRSQTIALSAGANWFSTYVDITLDDLKAALVEALPNATNIVIKSKTQNAKYNGTTWRGDLTWDLSKMYLITVESDCEITLEGVPINPADHPATILSGQTNWIAFPVHGEMTLSEAFANFNAIDGDVIKSKTGNARYTGTSWRASGLTTLEPGKGYLFNSATTTESRTLVFPSGAK